MTMKLNKHTCNIELLLPAGSTEAAKAAIQNGANAIYLGGKSFSARQNATNFDNDELKEIISYSHLRGVKVYKTLNTLIFDNELSLLVKEIKTSILLGIDAFIVEDLAVLKLIKEISPSTRIHASTQLTVHTLNGALQLKELGVQRVVLARELSKEEIKYITSNCGIETEVFVHGALCMSVSGQCYASGIIGGRSGNRGQCAGTCRLPFSVGGSDIKNDYALSLKDNCLIEKIDELKELGVSSLKVEGRMKRPEYVAAAGEAYRNALNEEGYNLDNLTAVFSRSGFTSAYFDNEISKDMFGIRRKEDVTSATNKLLKSLEQTYQKEHSFVEIEMDIKIQENSKIELLVKCSDISVLVTSDAPQKALNRSITEPDVLKNLLKLGGTYYFCDKVNITLSDGLFVPASQINDIRRNAIELLDQKRSSSLLENQAQLIEPNLKLYDNTVSLNKNDKLNLRGRFLSFLQLDDNIIKELEYFSLPIKEVLKNQDVLLQFKDKLILEPDRVMFENEMDTIKGLKELYSLGFDKLYCLNISHIKLGNDLGFKLFGTPFLNCTNSLCLDMLKSLNICEQELSFELNLSNAKHIVKPDNIKLGLLGYGYLPIMIYRSCPIKAKLGCNSCNNHGFLTDRMNKNFDVICRHNGYSEMLNTDLLYMGDRQHELDFLDFITLYFTKETKNNIKNVIDMFKAKEKLTSDYTRGLYYRNI